MIIVVNTNTYYTFTEIFKQIWDFEIVRNFMAYFIFYTFIIIDSFHLRVFW